MEGKMSENLKESILKGNSKYIKDSMLLFDEIVFKEIDGGIGIRLCNKSVSLVTYYRDNYKPGNTISFCLNKGIMKVELV